MINLDKNKINELIGVKENYKAPDKLMGILMNKKQREELFEKFLNLEDDLSQDFFRRYFQEQQADRGNNKQDFTPNSIAKLTALIVGNTQNNLDTCCGTGTLTIAKWWHDKKLNSNVKHHYSMIELTESAMPFLLFNMAIRGMNATVINGDVLTKKYQHVYELTKNGKYSDIKEVKNIDEGVEKQSITLDLAL